ncbi:MAG TPA: methyltransferase [Candidatus Baltobacteraceae bacterium]|nr:methyltransferase [Candidatus Baltobacteraceae bacterium]
MSVPPPWLVGTVTRLADVLAKLRRRIVPRRFGVIELGTMSWVALSLAAFCELGLPDALAKGTRTPDDLAAHGYGDRDRLFRLLRALAAYDVVKHVGGNRFALAHLGKALIGKDSASPLIRYANTPWHGAAYANLVAGVRENRPGFEIAQGMPMFSYFEKDPSAGAIFDAAMQSLTPLFAPAFAVAYDFSRMRRVVDVGGGTGALLAAVLTRFPNLRGTVFDLPSVVQRVQVTERLDAIEGNILATPPPPADAYIFSHVLHDWDDASCERMLQNVRTAMPEHSRVLVYEIIAPPPNNWWTQDRITDLEMLAMLPGRERTREEFAALFERAGLRLGRIIPTGAPESILEAAVP